ncbi:MAG: hypothetical protein ACJA1R_003182, partial [Flavobacteriales bacterium]
PASATVADASSEEPSAPEDPSRTFEMYAQEAGGDGGTSAPAASASPPDWRRLTDAELLEPTRSFPYVETHGYFRFRTDSFWNLDLDTYGTSPVLPPVESLLAEDNNNAFAPEGTDGRSSFFDEYTDQGAERLSSANIRMRLRPTFHITDKLSIHLELNILDNMVLGSTAEGQAGLRADLPLVGFTGSQTPGMVNITQAYGEVNTFFGTIRLGRQASHWGLGILANGGGSYSALREPRTSNRGLAMAGHTCLDCDGGDYVDRAMFITNLFNTYVALAWDFNFAGPLNDDPLRPYEQPLELSHYDDVTSYVFSVFQRPIRPEEIAARNRTLKELRQPAFDWGLYLVYRRQRLTSEPNAQIEDSPTDYTWFPRGARAVVPDLWLRLQSEPAFRTRIRLELEFAAVFGSIDNANPGDDSSTTERDIRQFGGAMEFEYVRAALATGMNAGFATGRTLEDSGEGCSQYQPGFQTNGDWTPNDCEPTLSNFQFDRNYFVDMLMFREVTGTITNAAYLNPFFQYDLFSKQDDNLSLRLDIITAWALNAETTPSGKSFFGLETDITLSYREPTYGADLSAGFYFPGAVFDGVEGRPRATAVRQATGREANYASDRNANPAYTLQARFFWAF